MSALSAAGPYGDGNWLRLTAVDWITYLRLLHAFAERRGVRLTYDRGELEITSSRLLGPEFDSCFLARLVTTLTEDLRLPLKHGGSTTLRRKKRRRGIEPDKSFWIANAGRMAGRRRLDLRRDPPPDLVLEVDVMHSSLDRLGIYAALGVPEVWRLDGDNLTFYTLDDRGQYQPVTASRSFPLVAPADLLGFLKQARQAGGENAVVRQFREWIRQRTRPIAESAPPT